MNYIKIIVLTILMALFVGCSSDKHIIESTNGTIDTNANPTIVFDKAVIDGQASLYQNTYDNSGEITINGNEFYGSYVFDNDHTFVLLPNQPFDANKSYTINIDFVAINDKINAASKSVGNKAIAKIPVKSHKMNFKTKEILIDLPNANFVKDNGDLEKIKLEAEVEVSQQITLETIKNNVKLLDSNNNNIDIDVMQESRQKFKIISTSLDSPKENDENYKIIFDKEIGLNKDMTTVVTAVKTENLDIINIKTSTDSTNSIEVRFSDILATNMNLDNFIKITPDIKFSVSQANDTINIKANFNQNKKYTLEILPGIKSQNNLELKQAYTKEIEFYDKEPKIVFSNEGVFLPDSAHKKIAFKSINVKHARVKISKIYTNNITQFLLDNEILKKSVNDIYYERLKYIGNTIKIMDIDIKSSKNSWVQNEIDISSIKDSSGIFLVSLHFDKDDVDYNFPLGTSQWKQDNYFYDNGTVNRQIIFSNIALIAQKAGNNIIATAIDVQTNKPISNVLIQAISHNNQIISSAKSDKNGNVILESTRKIEDANLDLMYLMAQKDNDISILKLRSQQISNDGFDVDGVSTQNGVKAFIYTDRGVYRPGEKINLNIIARNDKQAIEHPIKLTIKNPRNKKIINNLNLDSLGDGVYYYEFETTKNADTGIYEASINIGDNIFTHQIAVETVVPNRIKVDINAEDSIDINNNANIQFSIQSDYLFGAPASNLEYEIYANITPKNFISKKYKGWTFDNPTNLRYTNYKSQSGKLDDNGFIQQNIKLDNISEINKNLEAIIIAKVFENNGKVVSNRKTVELNRFDSFVGIKIPQTRYIKKGENISIPVVLVDKNENLIPNRKLKYKVYVNNYSWWWDYNNYNNFVRSIKSDRNTYIIKEGEINTKNEISNIAFNAKDRGEILLEVIDTSNNQSASISLYASSWGEPLDIDKITQLKIKSDKNEYTHNENAKITFESVKNGKALVVISNDDNILDRYWVDTNEFQTTINIKIDEKYAPNIYASVFLLQDYESANNDRALRLYGVLPIKIIDSKTKIDLNIDVKNEILPNSILDIEISNAQNKEVTYTLAVVDEGLINLTNFKTPSPWNYFYAKSKLGITSYDTYDYIINKTIGKVDKVYSIGGDEESSDSANRQKDDSADRFKPVVFFAKPFKSDKSGKAKLSFEVPSYLGSLRIMLIAVDKNSYGSANKDVRVSAPVVMLPTIPRSLKVNDNFKLPVEILPIQDDIKSATINIKSDGIINFSPTTQSVTFNDKKSKTIFFNGTVKEELGIENITISLDSGSFSMKDTTQIDIKAPNPYTLISKNYTLDSNKSITIESPTSYIKNSNKGKITISASPIISIDHRLLWLIRYPYGCIEQTTSSVFPQLFIDKLSNANFIDKETMVHNINAGIARIATFQTADGGFSYWQGGGSSNEWGSSYAGHFLLLAKKQGYYVNEELLRRWVNYEIRIAHSNVYPLYLLALSGNEQLGMMNEIYENNFKNLSNTSRWLLAAAYKIAGFDDIARKITNGLSVVPNDSDEYYLYSYGSNLRNKAMILEAYHTIYGTINQSLYDEITSILETNESLSTQTTSYALMVLANIKENAKNAMLEGKITINNKMQTFKQDTEKITFELNNGKASIESNHNLFANYTWEGISLDNNADNIAKNMRLYREFVMIDSYGNESPINPRELNSAQSFYIKLTLHTNSYNTIQNIALTQNLPSGWEIENTRLNNDPLPSTVQDANDKITYIDIRDDKIMWFFDLYDYKVAYVKINVVTPGEYTLPAAYAEAMYDNNYQASTDSFRVKVNAKH